MPRVQPWYDPSFDAGQPVAITYWAAFVGTRTQLNQQKMEARLKAIDPSLYNDDIQALRKEIAELTKLRGEVLKGDAEASRRLQGDIIQGIFDLEGKRIGADAQTSVARMGQAGRLAELDSAERDRYIEYFGLPPVINQLAQESIQRARSGVEASPETALQDGLNKAFQEAGVIAGTPQADAVRHAFATALLAEQQRGQSVPGEQSILGYFGGTSPDTYMQNRYGGLSPADQAARRQEVLRQGGVRGPDYAGLLSLAAAVGAGGGGSAGGGSGGVAGGGSSGSGGGGGQADAQTLLDQQIQAREAELAMMMVAREQAITTQQRATDEMWWANVGNPLLAPVYHRRHRAQGVLDTLAQADPRQAEALSVAVGQAGGDLRKVTRADIPRGEPAYHEIPPEMAGGWLFDHLRREMLDAGHELQRGPTGHAEALAHLTRVVRIANAVPASVRDAHPQVFEEIDAAWGQASALLARQPREVSDPNWGQPGGSYRYRQHPDGRIELLTDKDGQPLATPQAVAPGSRAHAAITAAIGAYPQDALPAAVAGFTGAIFAAQDASAHDIHFGEILGEGIDAALAQPDSLASVNALIDLQDFAEAAPPELGGTLGRAYNTAIERRLAAQDGAGLRRDVQLLRDVGQQGPAVTPPPDSTSILPPPRTTQRQQNRAAAQAVETHLLASGAHDVNRPAGSGEALIDRATEGVPVQGGDGSPTRSPASTAPAAPYRPLGTQAFPEDGKKPLNEGRGPPPVSIPAPVPPAPPPMTPPNPEEARAQRDRIAQMLASGTYSPETQEVLRARARALQPYIDPDPILEAAGKPVARN